MKSLTIGIFVIVSALRTGDNNQVQGIVDNLQELLSNSSHQVNSYGNFEDGKELTSKLVNSDNTISLVIGVGKLGIEQIINIQTINPHKKIIFVWSGHQIMPGMLAMDKDTIISLPRYAINNDLAKKYSKIIPIVGVPNNLTEDKLNSAFNQYEQISSIREPITLIILPGDAPDSSGSPRLYTNEDVVKLADYIGEQAKMHTIPHLIKVTNGPRTGKHDKLTKQLLDVHGRNINDKNIEIDLDYVTEAFCHRLGQLKLNYELYNFDFRFLPSAYYPLLGCALQNRSSKIFVPGASSSMLSEISDIFPMNTYLIVEGPNMNAIHHRDVDIRYDLGVEVIKQQRDKTYSSSKRDTAIKYEYKSSALTVAKYLHDILKSN